MTEPPGRGRERARPRLNGSTLPPGAGRHLRQPPGPGGTAKRWFWAGLWCVAATVHAADPPAVPDAGSVLRELPRLPLRPPAVDADTVLPPRPAATPTPRLAPGASFVLRGLNLRGNTAFDDATLQALLADAVGQPIDLPGLEALAERITRHYRAAGYTVARAYLPAQDVTDGRVVIGVVEGRFGAIVLRGDRPVPERLLPLNRLRPGDLVADAPLEQALLLTSDLPGVRLSSTLEPGAEVGTSNLVVEVAPGPKGSARIELDNHGAPATGRIRLGTAVVLANPAGLGDTLAARLLFTQDDGLHSGRVAWQLPVTAAGTRVGASASELRYRLGGEFEALGAHGRARVLGLNASHPLLRSRRANLGLQASWEDRRLSDAFDSTGVQNDKDLQALSIGLVGDRLDDWGGGGATSASLTWTHGRLHIDSADARAADAASARADGDYERVNLSLQRLQSALGGTLDVSLRAQWASKNLDSSEKFGLGGIDAVRAYPQGEAAGDQAQLLRLEWRRPVAPGWQVQVHLDAGWSRLNARPWTDTRGPNQRHRAGAGLGLAWEPLRGVALEWVYAHRLAGPPAGQPEGARGRWWLQTSVSL